MKKDVVIVGAGPAGIFTALEMIRHNSKKSILIVEKGKAVEDRTCPKHKTKQCVNCKPYCHITTGFSGAGAFSDGKLSLSYEVGGDLPTLIGAELAQETIDYTDSIYLEFGADTHVEGIGMSEEVKEIRKRAIRAGLKLVDCPIRHLGTEKAQDLYYAIEQYLLNHGVEILFGYACTDLAFKEFSVDDNARSDTGTERNYYNVVTILAGAKTSFTKSCYVGIVTDKSGNVKVLAELLNNRNLFKIDVVGVGDNSLLGVNSTGNAHAYCLYVVYSKTLFGDY